MRHLVVDEATSPVCKDSLPRPLPHSSFTRYRISLADVSGWEAPGLASLLAAKVPDDAFIVGDEQSVLRDRDAADIAATDFVGPFFAAVIE